MKSQSSAQRRWSSTVSLVIGLSLVVVVVLAVAWSFVGVAYIVRGDEGISDNWVGALGAVGTFSALGLSAVNMVAAPGHLSHLRRRPLLWLAIVEFPALLAPIALLEVFIIE